MLYSWLKHIKDNKKEKQQKEESEQNQPIKSGKSNKENFKVNIFPDIKSNIENFKKMFGDTSDFTTREFKIGKQNHRGAIIFIDGLVDKNLIQEILMKNLQLLAHESEASTRKTPDELVDSLMQEVISVSEVTKAYKMDDVSLAILSGDTALFIEGTSTVLVIGSKGWETRSIEEPVTEGAIRGPRDGFVESVRTNTTLIRRHIRDPNLRFIGHKIGRRSKQELVIAYIEGIVNPHLVKEVNRRLQSIDTDDALESGIIEQWIEDDYLSPFPQVQHTERPDRVCDALLGGKIAIILDGTPFVLVVPFTFGDNLQTPEDYYERWIMATLLRMLRYLAAFIAVFLPSLYIALVSYHQGMIPSKLAFSIAATREGVPFPAFVEAMAMAITMELLREAGVRLPKPIGQTIGIVGGLVIGEAAVSAGIVSPIMVIIVAVTAIASFSLPSYSVAISFRMIRFLFMFAAAIFGFYGVILCYIMINIHIVNLKSFGVPYSTPFAPNFMSDWLDLLIRAPLTINKKRPKFMQVEDETAMDKGGNSS
jgi:spore germination protein